MSLFEGRAVECRLGGAPVLTGSARPVESSFVGVEVLRHKLKHADDRVVENLLVAKVHPDGAHDEAGNACLHPELQPPASGLHIAVGRRPCLPDPARDDAVGFQPRPLDLTHDVPGVGQVVDPPPDQIHQDLDVHIRRLLCVDISHHLLTSR